MTWNPANEYALRVELRPDGKYAVYVRTYENRGNRKRGSSSYDSLQDLEQELWVLRASYGTLIEACVHCYVEATDKNNAIREVDLGGLDPLGPEVAFVKTQFEKLTL
jgi:hypothetical protein